MQSQKTKIVTLLNCLFLHPFTKIDSQNTESKYFSSALTLSTDKRTNFRELCLRVSKAFASFYDYALTLLTKTRALMFTCFRDV